MTNVTVSLTDIQTKCLEYSLISIQDWVDNSLYNRARIAQNEIIKLLVEHCNNNEIAMAVGSDAQVTQAYDLGIVTAAASSEE
jgi:hypothetical protein|tara:strand:- start:6 stop:254 length:249 start_codon:yes stop_codon:yes gene_type:complete